MTRHIIDRPTDPGANLRLRQFLRIARQNASSRISRLLHRRPVAVTSSLPQFLRIARGRST